jgi:hypothetical protein
MAEGNDKAILKDKAYNKKEFIVPLIVYIVGFVICFIFAQKSDELTVGAFIGYIVLSIGTIMILRTWVNEKYRLGLKIKFPLSLIFPSYPLVEDYDELTRRMSSFKTAYSQFIGSKDINKDNSKIQEYATQLLWHSIYLQKRRLEKLNVQIDLQSSRRSYSKNSSPVRSSTYFDGRYNVDDAYEEIYCTRTYQFSGKDIKRVYDKEVAHYTFLSAKNVGGDDVVCPNCGSISSRSSLIYGCDFCGTKFTVEDLDSRVGSFGFGRDFQVIEGKREAIKKLIYPWIYMMGMLPFINMGFFLPFLYVKDMNIFMRFVGGLLSAFALGFAGFGIVTFSMFFIVPIVFLFNLNFEFLDDKLVCRPKEKIDKEIKRANEVRKYDPLFSIQSFFGGVQNKLYAVHFADTGNMVNAFSECDLSRQLENYKDVVDMDTLSFYINTYQVKDDMQIARVSANLLLRELKNGKIENRKEFVTMRLEKNKDCKTQAVCGPSILKCIKCGANLSLIEGKTCEFCGNELNLKEHDWVITKYHVYYKKSEKTQ